MIVGGVLEVTCLVFIIMELVGLKAFLAKKNKKEKEEKERF